MWVMAVGAAVMLIGLFVFANADNIVKPPPNTPFATAEVERAANRWEIVGLFFMVAGTAGGLVGLNAWCRGAGEDLTKSPGP